MAGAGGYLIMVDNEQDDLDLRTIGLGLVIPGGVIGPIVLCWYLYQACVWPDFQTKNWVSPREASKILAKAAATEPVLAQKMECYHWESDVDSSMKVVTLKVSHPKIFESFYDYAPHINVSKDSSRKQLLTLKLWKHYKPADPQTEESFQKQTEQMIDEYKNYDTHYNYEEEYSMEDVPDTLIVNRYRDEGVPVPCLYSNDLFGLCTILLFGAPWAYMVTSFYSDFAVYDSLKVLSMRIWDERRQQVIDLEKESKIIEI